MARSTVGPGLLTRDQGSILDHSQMSDENVMLDVRNNHDESSIRCVSDRTSNCDSAYLNSNQESLNSEVEEKIHDASNKKELLGNDELMNVGNSTQSANTEIMNLMMSRQAQEEEQQEGTYSCIQAANLSLNAENGHADTKLEPEEVTTYVTEDGQTGQIYISGGVFSSELNGSDTLGESSITTITSADGQVLSIDEEAMEQLAGLGNFHGGSIQLTTTQNADGTTQLQYILKQEQAIKEEPYNSQQFNTSSKKFHCDIDNCSKQFSTPYRLKAHGRTHTGETFSCMAEGCKKIFVTLADLQKHEKTHFGQKDYVCEVENCKKEFTTSHHLKVHQRQHSGERPFICCWEGCGKMFTTGYGLKSHFRTHTNERPYHCQNVGCTKAFKTSGDLQKHVRTHTGERPFLCPYEGCNRSFTTSNIRKVHFRTHTGEKPYKCEIDSCGRTFASATNYKNHSRIHTGERPYVCEVPGCLKRFTEYSSLYKHNIVHTQQKPYTCSLCHKTYRQTSTLAMHKRTVHGTEDVGDGDQIDQTIRRKKSQPAHLPVTSTATGILQGMSLVINNPSSSGVDEHFSSEISAQQLPESSEIPGAIAIPIQVTMNADGTIAGAQGLNLTDGSGRMIPVNLSVSIQMPSIGQVEGTNEVSSDGQVELEPVDTVSSMETIYTESNKLGNVVDILTRNVTERENRNVSRMNGGDSSEVASGENIATQSSIQVGMMNGGIPTTSCSQLDSRQFNREPISSDQFESDLDEGDVTDKYLTSHYRKDIKS